MNKGQFDYFVIFAEMRTGSNFLESNLNALNGVSCLGESFNPAFLGAPDTVNILGLTQMQRDADPHTLLDAMQSQSAELCGFRFFHDHDARILDRILDDPRCAKVILRRNPLDPRAKPGSGNSPVPRAAKLRVRNLTMLSSLVFPSKYNRFRPFSKRGFRHRGRLPL